MPSSLAEQFNKAPSQEPQRITLSPLNPDPVASMRIWGGTVLLGDKTFRVPALDAASWLEVLLAETQDLEQIFPGFCGPEAVLDVNQMLLIGQVGPEDLEKSILDLLEEVSGRRWWITIRLCYALRRNWESAGGELARHGVTPFHVPLSYWLDAAYTTMIRLILEGQKPKIAEDFTRALTTPPASEGRNIDEEQNSLAFLAAMRNSR